jgi:trimethylamine:corrinoid methyltransferase-like protein
MLEPMIIRPSAAFNLTPAQCAAIHGQAVELAERVGLQVSDAGILQRLAGRPGFLVEGNRVHPSAARIEAYVAGMRARHHDAPPIADAPPILYATDRPLYLVDDDGARIRPFTTQDVIDGAKLVAMLYDRGVRGGVVGLPADLPPAQAPFEQILIALRYGRCGGYTSHGFTAWHARYLEQIMRTQGATFDLSVWMPSPFRLEGNELEVVLAMEGRFDSLGVGSMPLMGITAPMNPLQTWIQALAETLGAAAILQELFPTVPVDIFPHPKPADLATGGYAMGTPEMHLFDALKSALLPWYGLQPPWGKSAALGAVVPGPQAMMEHTAAYVIGYLHGYRAFDMAGTLSYGDVFSPVQLLLDLEAVSWAERYARGVEWAPEADDIDRWARIAAGDGLFADDPDEVARMREVYRLPRYFTPVTTSGWIDTPRDPIAEAKRDVKRLIASHDVEPDWEKLRAVEAIVERAREGIGV